MKKQARQFEKNRIPGISSSIKNTILETSTDQLLMCAPGSAQNVSFKKTWNFSYLSYKTFNGFKGRF